MTNESDAKPTFKVTDRRGQPKEEPPVVQSAPSKAPEKPAERPQERPAERPRREAQGEPVGQGTIDFSTFVLSMSTSALMHMGLMEGPDGSPPEKNLPLARQEVGIVEMLATKTKGNLTPEEDRMVQEVLYELRVRFVQASR